MELTVEYSRIRAKLISIQALLTPHLEVMQLNMKSSKYLVQQDPNFSFANSVVDLAEKLET